MGIWDDGVVSYYTEEHVPTGSSASLTSHKCEV